MTGLVDQFCFVHYPNSEAGLLEEVERWAAGRKMSFTVIKGQVLASVTPFLPEEIVAQCVAENTVYVYLSPTLCYLGAEAFERLLEFRVRYPEHLLVIPNLVNNGYVDHLRQRMGLVEFAPFLATPTAHGTAWKHERYAEAVHWTFLRHERDGRLGEHEGMFERWILTYHEEVSLSCCAWFGEDMGQVLELWGAEESPAKAEATLVEGAAGEQKAAGGGHGRDAHATLERFLTRVAPKRLGRPNAICGGAVMVNYAFPHQKQYMDRTVLWQHYVNLADGKSLPQAVAARSVYPVEEMSVCFFTCDRSTRGKTNYIHQSLENLARATEGQIHQAGRPVASTGGTPMLRTVHLMIDGPKEEFIGDKPLPCEAHPVPPELWGGMDDVQGAVSFYVPQKGGDKGPMKNWDVHQRIAYSYERCFQKALEEDACGVLICEDDIDFRDGWLEKLQTVLDELAKDGKRWFTLSLYTVGDLDPRAELDMGDLYGIYPEWLFWGGQAVFFSRDAIQLAMDFWARRGWRDTDHAEDANDRLVGRFGHSLWRQFGMEGGHYRCYRDLVQHQGEITTGLSGYFHSSETFKRPWPGEDGAEG